LIGTSRRALILQVLYGLRSKRLLVEQLGYNLLYRWFVGLVIDDPVWDHSTFSKNRDRLIEQDVAKALFTAVLSQAKAKGLLSDEHFSVDGTLIRGWASHKSFMPKEGPPPTQSGSKSNPEVDFRGERRSNATHESTTNPDARLYRSPRTARRSPATWVTP
jgi:IS5 family transposase